MQYFDDCLMILIETQPYDYNFSFNLVEQKDWQLLPSHQQDK